MTQFQFRDHNRVIRDHVTQPACIFDKEAKVALRFLEFDEATDYLKQASEAYRAINAHEMADALVVFELPHDQEEIDKALTNISYPAVLFNLIATP